MSVASTICLQPQSPFPLWPPCSVPWPLTAHRCPRTSVFLVRTLKNFEAPDARRRLWGTLMLPLAVSLSLSSSATPFPPQAGCGPGLHREILLDTCNLSWATLKDAASGSNVLTLTDAELDVCVSPECHPQGWMATRDPCLTFLLSLALSCVMRR